MKLGGELGYRLLRWLKPGSDFEIGGAPCSSYTPKIGSIIGEAGWEEFRNKTIADFGCGAGAGCIELAQLGAKSVVGLDIQTALLDAAARSAQEAGVLHVCRFANEVSEPVDIIVSIDAFEHFEDPAAVLCTMDRLLSEDGVVLFSFGPTWYHPYGGHLFSIFPWSHLIFSESAQIRWRSDFRRDGATRFSEVAGGLNKMTIKRFLTLVEDSPFRFESFRTVPIRPLKWAHNRYSREFTTSAVEGRLVKKNRGRANFPNPAT